MDVGGHAIGLVLIRVGDQSVLKCRRRSPLFGYGGSRFDSVTALEISTDPGEGRMWGLKRGKVR